MWTTALMKYLMLRYCRLAYVEAEKINRVCDAAIGGIGGALTC